MIASFHVFDKWWSLNATLNLWRRIWTRITFEDSARIAQ